jgi:aerobic carbon-monoxide dehydrogenase medium subunit
MYETHYHRASSVEDAAALFAKGSDSKFLAGGQTLLPVMKQRLAAPTDVVDLARIPAMIGVEVSGDTVTIKAATTHYDVATNTALQKAIPALAALAGMIGDPAVRYRGTIGGSIANNDPAADYPAAVVGLNATVTTNTGKHTGDSFFKGLFETALSDGELVTSVSFPKAEKAAYMKFPNPASRYAMVGVFVAKTAGGVRVAVTGAGACVFRVKAMEDALAKNFSSDAIKDIKVPADGLNSDIHASAEYRAHLVNVMARRAVDAANK